VSNLHSLQRDFQSHIFRSDKNISSAVTVAPGVDARARLSIYSTAYRARLLESLQTDYPALRVFVSEETFDSICRDYAEAHPSTSPNIRWFGSHLTQFLKRTHPPEQGYLHEIAALEWAMTLAFDAADGTVMDISEMSRVPAETWPQMSFVAHPSLQRLELSWNVASIWKAVDAKKETPTATKGKSPMPWIVWRKELKIYFRSLAVEEAWAIDALIAGRNFSEICSGLCEWVDESQVAVRAAAMLKGWVSESMISAIRR
jgi:hypothetical protein